MKSKVTLEVIINHDHLDDELQSQVLYALSKHALFLSKKMPSRFFEDQPEILASGCHVINDKIDIRWLCERNVIDAYSEGRRV